MLIVRPHGFYKQTTTVISVNKLIILFSNFFDLTLQRKKLWPKKQRSKRKKYLDIINDICLCVSRPLTYNQQLQPSLPALQIEGEKKKTWSCLRDAFRFYKNKIRKSCDVIFIKNHMHSIVKTGKCREIQLYFQHILLAF